MSKIFAPAHLKVLNRLGDILLPQHGEFPSFSQTGVVARIDEIAIYAPASDMADLKMLLGILALAPNALLRYLVRQMDNPRKSGPTAFIYRSLNIGLKGLLYTLYFSEHVRDTYKGKAPLDVIGYSITRLELDTPPQPVKA